MRPVAAPFSGQVDVRLVSFSAIENELTRLSGMLTADELQRGNRLLDEGRRRRFFAGRGILREILGGLLGEEPSAVRLGEGKFGKPHLVDQSGVDALRFNVSHAGDYFLMAFATGREVGVDIEEIREGISFRAMAERYFSAREKEELLTLAPKEQLRAFYRCWTRKEAYMKGAGTGFSQSATGFDVSVLPQHPPVLLAHRGDPGEIDRWKIIDIEAPEGYCAALAVENI